jgi:hypothetical protein
MRVRIRIRVGVRVTIPPQSATAPLTAFPKHSHHSAGDCSAHPGFGCFVEYLTAQEDSTSPVDAKNTKALTLSVPPSVPTTQSRMSVASCLVCCDRLIL